MIKIPKQFVEKYNSGKPQLLWEFIVADLETPVSALLKLTRDKDYKVNSRICGNVFYDGTKLPIDKIDWTGLKIAEDYYVTLQLLTMGYQNKISLKYRVDPHETQSKGGCSTFRSLDVHNDAMKQLQQKFPSFVKLKEKVAKNSGEWSNKVKLAAVIQWKKAYQSSQVNTLDAFMT